MKKHSNAMQVLLNLMLILSVLGVPAIVMFTKFAKPR